MKILLTALGAWYALTLMPATPKLDELKAWSKVKLDILEDYLPKYTKILDAHHFSKRAYIDAFAGAGHAIDKDTGHRIETSPKRALRVDPGFSELHFIEHNGRKFRALKEHVSGDRRAHVHKGDCNELIQQILPKFDWDNRWRVFCFLDPYGMQLAWETVELCARMKTVEVLINFPIEGINRNVLRHNRSSVHPGCNAAMDRMWGDNSWIEATHTGQGSLFAEDDPWHKASNDQLAEAFRRRLKEVAGFKHVPKPAAMKNSSGATVYYLFFAGPNETGSRITGHLLDIVPRLYFKYAQNGISK